MARFNPYAVEVARMLSLLEIDATRVGDSWVAKCPSGRHEDNHPSWSIKDSQGDSRHGCHYCFSCKWGGTAAELVSHVVGFTLAGAYAWLVDRAMGANLAEAIDRLRVQVRAVTRDPMQEPDGLVSGPLEEWAPSPARFALKRGISAWQVKRWGLGYFVDGRLAGRLFIPARAHDGALCNYTARTYVGSPARYISARSDEHPVPGAIFGELHWPAPAHRDVVVVTEGALNALAVERVSDFPVASLFGSSVQLGHLVKIATFKRVLVCTDPDLAGDAAAERLMGALARHAKVGRVMLPRVEGVKQDANDVEPSVLKEAIERGSRV